MGILIWFFTERDQRMLPWWQHSRCHSFFLWSTFQVPTWRTLIQILLEIFLIQYQVELLITLSALSSHNTKMRISLTHKKIYFKKENAFLLHFEKPYQLFFTSYPLDMVNSMGEPRTTLLIRPSGLYFFKKFQVVSCLLMSIAYRFDSSTESDTRLPCHQTCVFIQSKKYDIQ